MNTSLGSFPNNVCVVECDQFTEGNFDELAPLIVRGAVARAAEKWSDEWLLHRFAGDLCQISLDSRTALDNFKRRMALRTYMKGIITPDGNHRPTGYLFHTQRDFAQSVDLLEDIDVPAVILDLGYPSVHRFFAGPVHSGTLPHVHTYAINALARGRKRWAIYIGAESVQTEALLQESYRGYGSGSQAKDWFINECPKLRTRRDVKLWEFAQEAGDLVYIPDHFIHAVVNLETVVGFTVEFQPPQGLNGYVRRQPPIRRPMTISRSMRMPGSVRRPGRDVKPWVR
jgi:JmjC domain-containing hydroxylase